MSRGRHADTTTVRLAERVRGIRFDTMGERARRIAAASLLDWIGVTLAGWRDPAAQAVIAEVEREGALPAATLIGSGGRVSARQAALANGTASHALDLDDVHLASRVHPSAPLWPALLAAGEEQDASGRDLVAAFVAGVEMQSRLAQMMGEDHYRRGWHNTATLGCFGAAAAVAHLARLDADGFARAIGVASVQAAGLRAAFATMSKPFQVGRAAENGLLAVRLAIRGMGGPRDVLDGEGSFGALFAAHRDPLALDGSVPLACETIIYKFHASCYGTQAPIEAALRLAERMPDAAALRTAEVVVEPQYLSVCNVPDPGSATECRFSIRHAVALALAGRDTMSQASFSVEAARDPVLAGLRSRITVIGDPSVARANACIHAQTTHGPLTLEVDASRPEPDLDRQWLRVAAKFRTLAAGHLSGSAVERVIGLCARIDALESARMLTAALTPPCRSLRTPLRGETADA